MIYGRTPLSKGPSSRSLILFPRRLSLLCIVHLPRIMNDFRGHCIRGGQSWGPPDIVARLAESRKPKSFSPLLGDLSTSLFFHVLFLGAPRVDNFLVIRSALVERSPESLPLPSNIYIYRFQPSRSSDEIRKSRQYRCDSILARIRIARYPDLFT